MLAVAGCGKPTSEGAAWVIADANPHLENLEITRVIPLDDGTSRVEGRAIVGEAIYERLSQESVRDVCNYEGEPPQMAIQLRGRQVFRPVATEGEELNFVVEIESRPEPGIRLRPWSRGGEHDLRWQVPDKAVKRRSLINDAEFSDALFTDTPEIEIFCRNIGSGA